MPSLLPRATALEATLVKAINANYRPIFDIYQTGLNHEISVSAPSLEATEQLVASARVTLVQV